MLAPLLLVLQVGPNSALPPPPAISPELVEQRARSAAAAAPDTASRSAACEATAAADPSAGAAEALAWLEHADDARGWRCLALARTGQERWGDATTAYGAAHGLTDPAETVLRAQLAAEAGKLAGRAGDAALALEWFDRAGQTARAAGTARLAGEIAIDRAIALAGAERWDEARAALAEAREAAPSQPDAYTLSAAEARRRGALDEARTHLSSALALAPDDPSVLLEAAAILQAEGRPVEALAALDTIRERHPRSVEAQLAEAAIARAQAGAGEGS